MKKASEIIEILGGPTKVANFLGIKPPSVIGWRVSDVVPADKLIMLAPLLERVTKNHAYPVTRKTLFPDLWPVIWPELINKKSTFDSDESKLIVKSA